MRLVPQSSRLRLGLMLLIGAVVGALIVLGVGALRGGPADPPVASATTTAPTAQAPMTTPAGTRSSPAARPSSSDADVSDLVADVTAGPADPKEAATQFLVKWLNTQGKSPERWRAGMTGLATADLTARLDQADPSTVPAGRVGYPLSVARISTRQIVVTAPLVNGNAETITNLVKVTMIGSDRWLASDLVVTAP